MSDLEKLIDEKRQERMLIRGLWIGTFNAAFSRNIGHLTLGSSIALADEAVRVYAEKHGMPGSIVAEILKDRKGE